VAFLSSLGPEGVMQDKGLLTARAVEAGAPGLGRLVAFAVAISALGTTHAILLTAPRQILALARDGLAPRILGGVSPRTATPVPATSLIAVISAGLVVVAGFEGLDALLDAVICVNWFFFAVTAAALIALRRSRPGLPRPFRVPGYPFTPVAFGLIALAAAASPFFQENGRGPALVALALVLTLGILSRFWISRANPDYPKSREST
jgi:APA family basic amino acid/polyamine antiporter